MRFTRLSHQILAVFVAVVMLALGVSGWAVTTLAQRIVADNVHRGHQELARRIAEEIDLQIEDIRPILSQLAASVSVRSMDAAEAALELSRYQILFPAIRRAYVANQAGQQIVRTDGQPLENVATTFGFQVAREGHELVSDVYLPRGGQGPILSVYVPITDDDGVVGVLVADVSFIRVQAILESLALTRNETTVVFAQNGRAVAHSRMAELAGPPVLTDPALMDDLVRGPIGILEGYTDELGRRVVGVHAPVSELGWGVVIQTPVEELAAEVAALRRTMGAGLLGGVGLAVVAGWLMARRLAEPIGRLAQATERVAAGDLAAVVEVSASNEVGVLATSFNKMVAALKESRDKIEQLYAEVKELNVGLERRVVDRTKELATLNAIAAVVSRSLDLEETLDNALDKVLEVLAFESGAIYLKDPKTGDLQMACHRGLSETFRHVVVAEDIISATAAESGNPLIIDDLFKDPDAPKEVIEEGYRSVASIPLVSKGQVEGVLTTASRQPRGFHQQDVDLLLSIGHQIGVAIENVRFFESEQRQAQEAETLRQAGAVVVATLRQDEAIERILQQLERVVPYDSASVELLREGYLEIVGGRGFSDPEAVLGIRFSAEGDIPGKVVIQECQPLILADAPAAYTVFREEPHSHIRSWLGVPLIVRDQVIGMLTLDSALPNYFTPDHARLAAAFADQVAIAIENSRLFEAEQRRAEQFQVISEVGHHITSILDVDELLWQIARLIRETLGYYLVGIALIEGDELIFKTGAGGVWETPRFQPPRLKVGWEGITGWVAQSGEPLLVPDVSQEPRYYSLPEASEIRSELAVPLKTKEAVIGVLHAQSDRPDAFDQSAVAVFQSLAHQAAVAIDNARLFTERARRIDEMAVLNEVGRAISSALRLDELLDLIYHQAGRVMDATNLYIALYDKDEDWLSFPLYVEGDRVRRDAGGRKAGRGLTDYIIRSGQPLLLSHDVEGRMQELGIESIGTAAKSWLGVPMIAGDEVLGVIAVQSYTTEDVYDEEHLSLLSTITAQAAIAIENARLYEQAQQLATENARLFDLLQERRIHEQAALLDMSNQLLSHLNLDDLMGYLVREVRSLLQAGACTLLLPGEEPDHLAICATSGWYRDPVAEQHRVPADERSGPGLVMRTQQPLLVEDIEESDPAPWTSDWLQVEGFRGHAVVPLVAEGHSIGALVLDARRPRLLDEDEVRFLRLMANQAAIAIEKARLHQEEVERQRLEEELRVARLIQQTLLPKEVPTLAGWQVAAYYQPARAVGGDFYDFLHLPDGQLGFVVGDVSGKGVPAALVMATTRAILRAAGLRLASPGQVLERVNGVLCPDMPPNMFVTCLYAVLDPASGRLQYASAGHNPPYRRIDGRVAELQATGVPLGLVPGMRYEEKETTLAPGESVLFSSDGLVEAHSPEREMFGFPRLESLIADHPGGAALIDFLLAELAAFTGPDWEQEDDVTLVTLQWCPANERT